MLNEQKAREMLAGVIEQVKAADKPLPWHKPWSTSGPGAPCNLRRWERYGAYRGINSLICWVEMLQRGWDLPFFVTYNDAKELGGHVRQGETGFYIMWAGQKKVGTQRAINDDGEEVEQAVYRWTARAYRVFNIAQCEGLEPPTLELKPIEPNAAADAVIDAYQRGPEVRYVMGSDRAAYRPKDDRIVMPVREQFDSPASFYATWAHEQGHGAAHPTRCNWPDVFEARRDTPEYPLGELVAEMTAALFCGAVGLPEVRDQSAAYVRGFWVEWLEANPRALITAASRAQRAFDFITGKEQTYDTPDTQSA